MWRLFRFGGPNGMQMIVESAAFSMITLFLGQLGAVAMSATTLAFNVNAVAFIPMVGVSIAVSTLVGQQLTGGTADRAARATRTAMQMGLMYSFVVGAFCLLTPELFMLGHAAGVEEAEFAEIRSTTVTLLRYVAAYCLFDTLQIVFVGALKGAGDTRFVLLTTVIVSAVSVLGGWLGAKVWGGVFTGGGVWSPFWICSLSVAYTLRFIQGKWRDMLVIEKTTELVDSADTTVEIAATTNPNFDSQSLRSEGPRSDQTPTKSSGRSESTKLGKSP